MKKKTLITALTIALALGTAALGNAWMMGPMYPGSMMGNQYALTADQQKKAVAIEAKHQKELADKEAAIRAKAAELDAALANGSTTLGDSSRLRDELYALEQDHWQLRARVNREISQATGTTYYGNMGWGPASCAWHDGHYGMYGGYGGHGRGQMMGGYGRGWCRW
ncbi:MAG: periplasmic heavy metal sensor [Desulfobacteraceae bacterium]|nr:periplasmic heavy metal sensor [Desulfobacteraceae bacterium]